MLIAELGKTPKSSPEWATQGFKILTVVLRQVLAWVVGELYPVRQPGVVASYINF